MKKLFIYGDSFAEEELYKFQNCKASKKIYSQFKSYHQVLRESNLYEDVVSFGSGGADFWSQYQKMNETYTGNEDVLLLLTHPGRFTIKGKNYAGLPSTERLISETLSTVLSREKTDVLSKTQLKTMRAIVKYYAYLYDEEKEDFIHNHILKEFENKITTNFFIVPCFRNSYSWGVEDKTKLLQMEKVLCGVFDGENRSWSLSNDEIYMRTPVTDFRRNHMTEPNHIVFGNKLIDLITKGIPIDFSYDDGCWYKPTEDDFFKYYTKVV